MKLLRAFAAACLAGTCLAAWPHAFLKQAEPAVGATVQAAPTELRIWFSENLEGAFSSAQVADAAGKRVDAGPAHVDAQDRKLLRVPLAKLGPGAYTVTWRAVSVDTHATQGHFDFRVAP